MKIYLSPVNWQVNYTYTSFAAKQPGIVGYVRFEAQNATDAVKQAVSWSNKNGGGHHRPLYPGTYAFTPKYIPWYKRIKLKW